MTELPDVEASRAIVRAAGVDPDRMEAVMAPLAELGAVRGPMAAAEMLKAMGSDYADAWLDGLLNIYRDAFGRAHPRDNASGD